jgi:carnitine 3-dehydrogenase
MLRSMNRERQQEPSPSPEIRRVAVVGAGTIGSGWATLFASKGLGVTLFDADPEAARAAADVVAATLRFLDQHDLLEGTSVEEAEGALRIATTLEDAVEQVHLVQEAVFESYEAKRTVFAALDAATPASVLLASSSSGLLMSEIQQAVHLHPERCLIAHPINPVYLIPLVELVPGERTSPAVREAIDLVHQGVASVEDVDKAIWAGPGLRYALMGPLLIYHLAGGRGGVRRVVDHFGPAVSEWWKDMRTWTQIPPGAVDVLEAGLAESMAGRSIEEVAAWRDGALVELVKRLPR